MDIDKALVRETLKILKNPLYITSDDWNLLFPEYSQTDFIADEPVQFPEQRATELCFKGMQKTARSTPLTIRLFSDSSNGNPVHTLTIAHSLELRATPDTAIMRSYVIAHEYADQIAAMHRTFFEKQSPAYVQEINQALQNRELKPRSYGWERFSTKPKI